MTDIIFKAKMGIYSSTVGQSVHLIAPEGHFAGQVALLCQDDRLRDKDTQARLLSIVCEALNRCSTSDASRETAVEPVISAHGFVGTRNQLINALYACGDHNGRTASVVCKTAADLLRTHPTLAAATTDDKALVERLRKAALFFSEISEPDHRDTIVDAMSALSNRLAEATSRAPSVPKLDLWPDADDIAEITADDDGRWLSCTGCHETNEGHPTGPYHHVLKCHVGLGCGECGGIGAIWDTTDYQDMADWLGKELVDDVDREEADSRATRTPARSEGSGNG